MSLLRLPLFLGAAVALAACSAAATAAPATPSPTAVPTAAPASIAPTASAVTPTPTSKPTAPAPTPVIRPSATPTAAATAVIRAETTQALAPQHVFASVPLLVITSDGRAIMQGAQSAIYPGPLLPSLLEQQISAAGTAKLLSAARSAGLLDEAIDFTGGAALPGGSVAQLSITDGGTTYHLVGSPDRQAACSAADAACSMPQPGTPQAFTWFWNGLQDLPGWLGPDLGRDSQPYVGDGYRILVGPPPADAIPGNPIAVWPLADTPLGTFGVPYSMAGYRCGVVTGDSATRIRPVLEKANQLTAWVGDVTQSATRSLIVRPTLPGDPDPCTGAQ